MADYSGRLPVFDAKPTRLTEHWFTHQRSQCAGFERDYYSCAHRVGGQRAEVECGKYLEDLKECAHSAKQFKRYVLMQAERKKQGLPYEPPPPIDSTNFKPY